MLVQNFTHTFAKPVVAAVAHPSVKLVQKKLQNPLTRASGSSFSTTATRQFSFSQEKLPVTLSKILQIPTSPEKLLLSPSTASSLNTQTPDVVDKVLEFDEDVLSKLQEEVPELSKILGRKANWIDAIYIFFELMKLNIEGKKQEQIWRTAERRLQLEQIQEVVKNLEKTAKDQYSAGLMGGLTGIFAGVVPMLGYTQLGASGFSLLQNSFSSFQEIKKPVEAFEKLGKMLSGMSEMEKWMMEVRKTNAEADRHRSSQYGDITRSFCDEISRKQQELIQDLNATLQAILQILNQEKELVNSVYGLS